MKVADTAAGLYAYEPRSHALKLLREGSYTDRLSAATYLAETMETAALCVLLVAQALGLGALPLGGYVDAQLNAIVGVDGCDHAVVYAVVVGRP